MALKDELTKDKAPKENQGELATKAKVIRSRKDELIIQLFSKGPKFLKFFEKKISINLILKYLLIFISLSSIPAIIFIRTSEHLMQLTIILIILLPLALLDARRSVKERNFSELATRRWIYNSFLFIIGGYLIITLFFVFGIVMLIIISILSLLGGFWYMLFFKRGKWNGKKKFLFYMAWNIIPAIFLLVLCLTKWIDINFKDTSIFGYLNIIFFGLICGEYLFYTRFKGSGLTLIFSLNLLFDFNIEPYFNSQIANDYSALIKNIDKWYSEELNLRIMNLNEIISSGFNLIATDLVGFREKFRNLLTENIVKKCEKDVVNYIKIENLSEIIKKISDIFNFKIKFQKNSFFSMISRNLTNIETSTMIFCTLISTTISIITSIIL